MILAEVFLIKVQGQELYLGLSDNSKFVLTQRKWATSFMFFPSAPETEDPEANGMMPTLNTFGIVAPERPSSRRREPHNPRGAIRLLDSSSWLSRDSQYRAMPGRRQPLLLFDSPKGMTLLWDSGQYGVHEGLGTEGQPREGAELFWLESDRDRSTRSGEHLAWEFVEVNPKGQEEEPEQKKAKDPIPAWGIGLMILAGAGLALGTGAAVFSYLKKDKKEEARQ